MVIDRKNINGENLNLMEKRKNFQKCVDNTRQGSWDVASYIEAFSHDILGESIAFSDIHLQQEAKIQENTCGLLYSELSEKIKNEYGVYVTEDSVLKRTRGFYDKQDGVIFINPQLNASIEEKLETLFHELCHVILHGGLMPENGVIFRVLVNSEKYCQQAELYSQVMCKILNIKSSDKLKQNSFGKDKVQIMKNAKAIKGAIKKTFKKVLVGTIAVTIISSMLLATGCDNKHHLDGTKIVTKEMNDAKQQNVNIQELDKIAAQETDWLQYADKPKSPEFKREWGKAVRIYNERHQNSKVNSSGVKL